MSRLLATDEHAVPIVAGAAVAVLLLSVLLFASVGAIRGDDDVTIGAPASETTPVEEDGAAADDEGAAAGEDTESSAAEGEEEATDGAAADDEAAADDGGGGEDAAASDDGDTEDAAAEEDTESSGGEAESPSLNPAEVSIQVLDAVGDGGATTAAVADELRAAGYDVVVVNPASVGYDVTTVFWTEGQGPGGRAVAATLGTDEARATPPETGLASTVDVHVVVGRDRS